MDAENKIGGDSMLNLTDFTVRAGTAMQHLYKLAFACGVAGITIDLFAHKNPWAEGLILLAGVLFGLGFCFRIMPNLKRIWSSSAGKWAIGGLNVVVWFLAHLPARLAVAKALGLPPQDFEMTVSIWTVAVYPAVWIVFMSLLTLCIFAASMLAYFVVYLSSFPLITEVIDFLAHLLPSSVGNRLKTENRRKVGTRYLAHIAGSAMLVIASAAILKACTSLQEYCLPAIPWIAYVADYQEAPAYPGIPNNQRVRLHENGVVSYAALEGRAVRIHVTEFSSSH